jgi:hypothetical protein
VSKCSKRERRSRRYPSDEPLIRLLTPCQAAFASLHCLALFGHRRALRQADEDGQQCRPMSARSLEQTAEHLSPRGGANAGRPSRGKEPLAAREAGADRVLAVAAP